MVTFDATDDCVGDCTWSQEEQDTILASAMITGQRLAETLNAAHGWNLSAGDAFLLIYGGSVNFSKTGQSCLAATTFDGCWGQSTGSNSVNVYTDADLAAGDARWGVHELGHSFVNAVANRANPVLALEQFQDLVPSFPDRPLTPNAEDGTWGFAGPRYGWQRSDQGRPSEEFADMFLGWAYNMWEPSDTGVGWSQDGQARANYMNFFMPLYVNNGN